MMVPKEQCRRCREWVSLELDVQLSQFEQTLVRRHLERCASCADFAADVRGATSLLRSADVQSPPAPVDVRLPRRASQFVGRTGMAAVAAAAAVVAVTVNGLTGSAGPPSAQADSTSDLVSMRLARAHQLRLPLAGPANLRVRVIETD